MTAPPNKLQLYYRPVNPRIALLNILAALQLKKRAQHSWKRFRGALRGSEGSQWERVTEEVAARRSEKEKQNKNTSKEAQKSR